MSNGIIEGSNNKIKVVKRVSYGYGDFYHLRNRILYIFNEDDRVLNNIETEEGYKTYVSVISNEIQLLKVAEPEEKTHKKGGKK